MRRGARRYYGRGAREAAISADQASGQETKNEDGSGEQDQRDSLEEIEIDRTQGFRVQGSGFRIIDERSP